MRSLFSAFVTTAAVACTLTLPNVSTAALDPAVACEAQKLKIASKMLSCRLKEESAALRAGETPIYSDCDEKLMLSWLKTLEKYGDACPVTGDVVEAVDMLTKFHQRVRSQAWEVTFSIDTVSADVSDLVVKIHYGGMGYEMIGEGPDVECEDLVSGASFSLIFDGTQDARLEAGWDMPGNDLTAGTPLMRCVFRTPHSDPAPPSAEDFGFVVANSFNTSSGLQTVTFSVSAVPLD